MPPVSAFTEDSLEVYLCRRMRGGRLIYLAVIAVVLGTLAALPVVRVSVTVAGDGVIRPMTEKHEVRARSSGIAERVAAKRGDRVDRGQVIAVLDGSTLREREALLAREVADLRGLRRDLELLTTRSPERVATGELESPRYREEHRQLLRELSEKGVRAEHARAELDRTTSLAARQLVAEQEVEEARFRLGQVEAARELAIGLRSSEWQAARLSLAREIAVAEGRASEIERERGLQAIETPVGGTVEELSSIAPGSFVQAGEVVAIVSPDADLIAEVYLPPHDIGLIREGMPVRIHVDAFDYQDWGHVPATVTDVSDDYLLVDRAPAFRVLAKLHRTQLELRNGFRGELRKGMTLQARFVLADRTLLQLLRDDINAWLHPWVAGSHTMASGAP